MISNKMVGLVQNSSIIRAMFEEGKRLADIYGAENVYDFSLGNPSVEPPKEIREEILNIINMEDANLVHGYMSNSGYQDVRTTIADSLNKRFQTSFTGENIIMTVGAAGGLNVILKTLLNPGDEVIVFSPFFGEYRNYVDNFDGKLVVVPPDINDFQPDLAEFETRVTEKTKAVIVNTPNNPTGVVYSETTIKGLADVLNRKQKEFGISIYLISDEPYRELVYDSIEVPYLTKYYNNTIVGYSFSKSLSLPGERIGYLVIPNEVDDYTNVVGAANVANRILGFVNAPSLMQRVVARCLDAEVDIASYNRNRELLYYSLREYGYTCIKPEGAFYLFVKALEEDDKAFAAAAKKHNILIVPGSSFGCPGYCRIAYCVAYETIKRSLPGFEKLAKEYSTADRS
ncbi:pyridoxal phosphate-dependent aminotransferase [Anaerocolumna aminovalerica]|jgi:aspartate aminotransferase|uniref:Aminotransferase n=1 Tax=Anaerocolumna aminovalerica TaxID=1527 RepID=A0A1I5DX33_9FIRM|nr:pyridoxal phosphate-dependent aminotransferase [Anaerocolumna aminovalerica]MDU6266003.1 pyridoxal phosphate-dependent aminotransferase [Anaerocolumna aminovalerica]SFO03763.1 aspartate aminotransferase [Anaerocolumna aminovalerica]